MRFKNFVALLSFEALFIKKCWKNFWDTIYVGNGYFKIDAVNFPNLRQMKDLRTPRKNSHALIFTRRHEGLQRE